MTGHSKRKDDFYDDFLPLFAFNQPLIFLGRVHTNLRKHYHLIYCLNKNERKKEKKKKTAKQKTHLISQ